MNDARSAGANLGQQPNNFDVEPNEGNHESECCVPLKVLGCAMLYTLLDEVEVEDEGHRCDADHEE